MLGDVEVDRLATERRRAFHDAAIRLLLLILVLAGHWGGRSVWAQSLMVMPNGTEFQVNSFTTAYSVQFGRGTCHEADGSFIVVWDSVRDGSGSSILGQRYASGGERLGTEFQVNTSTYGFFSDPAVCCSDDGFVVAWAGPYPFFTPAFAGAFILGQRFDSSGAFRGTEFQINSYSTLGNFAINPDLCCTADGDFVVVWDEAAFLTGGGSAIVGQRYASNGSSLGTEFVVNSYTTQTYVVTPGVCCDAAADFVVAWTRGNQYDADVFGQRYASSGNASGTEFQVNTYTTGVQGLTVSGFGFFFENRALCCDAAGDFVVAWPSDQSTNDADIFAQRFAQGGAFRGTEFQVNTYTIGFQQRPAVCCGPAGDFVVAWQDEGYYYSFNSVDLAGRRYASTGLPTDGQFQINTYSSAYPGPPSVSCAPGGGFVVTWSGAPPNGGPGPDVLGQRFKLALVNVPAAPTLSLIGLAGGIVALLAAAARAMHRRD